MSQSLIHNKDHVLIGCGINLDLLNRHAKKAKGVQYIRVTKMQTVGEFLKNGDAGAKVRVAYANEDYGDIEFADYKLACRWALRKRNRLGTYFSGCIVRGVNNE